MRRVILMIFVAMLLVSAVSAQETSPTPEYVNYIVIQGDTLGRIAARFDTTTREIMAVNVLTDPNLIFSGMTLRIPVAAPTSSAPTAAPPTDIPSTATSDATATPTPSPAPPTPPPIPFDAGGEILSFDHLDTLLASNIAWAKVRIHWRLGNPVDSARLVLDTVHAAGMKVLLQIVGDPQELGADRAAYLEQFSAYLGEVAALAPDAIEVWAEMNSVSGWATGQIDPAAYEEMIRAAFAAIKRVNPSTLVISGALAELPSFDDPCGPDGCDDLRYLEGMAAAGVGLSADCIGIPYTQGTVSPHAANGDPRGDQFLYYYSTVVSVYASFFPDKPLCFTEIGYRVPGASPFPDALWATNNTTQERAEWLGQALYLARLSGRIRLFVVYNIDASIGAPAEYAIVGSDGGCLACEALSAALRMR
ncbi:MAG: LysM peptidoglycan-binding domain-containing protein [Anaerolineae bacterium]|nr:LysM peptidoglycan-binding domain-containing protein [Anaerolineae bacterium]